MEHRPTLWSCLKGKGQSQETPSGFLKDYKIAVLSWARNSHSALHVGMTAGGQRSCGQPWRSGPWEALAQL